MEVSKHEKRQVRIRDMDLKKRKKLLCKLSASQLEVEKNRKKIDKYFKAPVGVCTHCLSVFNAETKERIYDVPKKIHKMLVLPKYDLAQNYSISATECKTCNHSLGAME